MKNTVSFVLDGKIREVEFYLDYVGEVHARARVVQGFGDDVACVVDVEIFRAPALDVVKPAGGFNVPRWRGVVRIVHLGELSNANYKRLRAEINHPVEKIR